VATYGAERWTLTVVEEDALNAREKNSTQMENNIWRIRYIEEIKALLKREDIVRFIKSQRLRWLGHVERMEDKTSVDFQWAIRRYIPEDGTLNDPCCENITLQSFFTN
jgi:hypothetical protein